MRLQQELLGDLEVEPDIRDPARELRRLRGRGVEVAPDVRLDPDPQRAPGDQLESHARAPLELQRGRAVELQRRGHRPLPAQAPQKSVADGTGRLVVPVDGDAAARLLAVVRADHARYAEVDLQPVGHPVPDREPQEEGGEELIAAAVRGVDVEAMIWGERRRFQPGLRHPTQQGDRPLQVGERPAILGRRRLR